MKVKQKRPEREPLQREEKPCREIASAGSLCKQSEEYFRRRRREQRRRGHPRSKKADALKTDQALRSELKRLRMAGKSFAGSSGHPHGLSVPLHLLPWAGAWRPNVLFFISVQKKRHLSSYVDKLYAYSCYSASVNLIAQKNKNRRVKHGKRQRKNKIL